MPASLLSYLSASTIDFTSGSSTLVVVSNFRSSLVSSAYCRALDQKFTLGAQGLRPALTLFNLYSTSKKEVQRKVFVKVIAIQRVATHIFGETHFHQFFDFVVRRDLTSVIFCPLPCCEFKQLDISLEHAGHFCILRIVYTKIVNLMTMDCLPGSGAQSRAWREISAVRIVRAGVHSFFRMSKQMAPVTELIFGCHILVSNFI